MKILLIRILFGGLLVVQSFFLGGAQTLALSDGEFSFIDDLIDNEYSFRFFSIDVLSESSEEVLYGQDLSGYYEDPHIFLVNDESSREKALKTKAVAKKTTKKIDVAHKPSVPPSRDMRVVVTAYSSTMDQTDSTPCITANGFNVCDHNKENVIAANFLPFGTKVRFPELFGEKVFTVQDRMHPRHRQRVDLWMKSRSEAKRFGVKRTLLEVVPDQVAIKQ